MAGLNKVSIIGNLGKDPEVRYTQGGTAVCNLRVGVTERRKEGDDWKDHTEWFTAICFGKTAENAGRFLKKGRQIYADGRLQTRNYQDKDGANRTAIEVVVNQLVFLGSKDGGGSDFADMGSDQKFSPSSTGSKSSEPDFLEEDDIPF